MAQSPSDGFLDAVKAGDTDTVRAMMHLPPSDPAAKPIVVPHAARTDPNTCDSDGSCALHWAAWVRARGAFVALLEAGADPSHCNARQESVLEWALRGGDLFILAQLLTIPLSPSPAVPQTLRLDSRNAFGGQAIHIAAEEGSTELLAALVLRGADINARDKRGKTPLMCAAHRNQPGAAQFLFRNGADCNLFDNENASAVHYGCIGGSEFIVREILKQGTASHLRVRAFANENLTPEEIATKYGHLGCAAGMKKWQARTEGFCNRTFVGTGLVPPAQSRPFLTKPQMYFFVGLPLTLLHFYLFVHPVLSSPQTDLAQDPNYARMLATMYVTALFSVIGMFGFMFLEPGRATKGPQLAALQPRPVPNPPPTTLPAASAFAASVPHSSEWLIANCLNGASVCVPCRIIKPIRSKHCALCGGCVLRMDHHCPWVNGCVAVSNHRSFFAIIISMLVAAGIHAYLCFFFVFTYCLAMREDETESNVDVFLRNKLVIFLMLHSCLIVLGCAGLLFGQSYTVSKGMTTNEAFNRFRYKYLANNGGKSPFSEGCIGNWLSFCGVRPGRSFVRPGQERSVSRAGPPSSYGENDQVVLEMNQLRREHEDKQASAHGHSHGGQACHGHGGSVSASVASASHSHSHAHLSLASAASPPAPTGSLHLGALLHPPHPAAASASASSAAAFAPEVDADCAYLSIPHGSSDSRDSAVQSSSSELESTGLLSGKDKTR